jgi:hypothetical protein
MAGSLIMFACAWIGDRYRVRGPVLFLLACLGLICATANSGIPAVIAYQANNIRGQWKRAFASATLVGFGGIGGIVRSTVLRTKDSP